MLEQLFVVVKKQIHCNHCDRLIATGQEWTDSIGDEIVAYFCSEKCMNDYWPEQVILNRPVCHAEMIHSFLVNESSLDYPA